jgi:hypothetical protein
MVFLNKIHFFRCFLLAFMIVSILLLGASSANCDDRELVAEVVTKFFNNLNNGSPKNIMDLISGPMEQKNGSTLKNGTAYWRELKKSNSYKKFYITKIVMMDEIRCTVQVLVVGRNNHSKTTSFLCFKENGAWKIVEELID